MKEDIGKGKIKNNNNDGNKYSRSKHWSDIWKGGFKCWNTCHSDLFPGGILLRVKDSMMFSYLDMILKA